MQSFLLWVILVTNNVGIYICIYIYEVSYIHFFLLSLFVMFFLHCMLNILSYKKHFVKLMSRLLQSTIHRVMWHFWVFIVNPFFLLWSIFFLKNTVFPLVTLTLAESINLGTSGKPTMGIFLKIASPSWIIFSVSLDELNLIDWLLKSW